MKYLHRHVRSHEASSQEWMCMPNHAFHHLYLQASMYVPLPIAFFASRAWRRLNSYETTYGRLTDCYTMHTQHCISGNLFRNRKWWSCIACKLLSVLSQCILPTKWQTTNVQSLENTCHYMSSLLLAGKLFWESWYKANGLVQTIGAFNTSTLLRYQYVTICPFVFCLSLLKWMVAR